MTPRTIDRHVSHLDRPPRQFEREPFYGDTLTLLRSVRDRDLSTVAWMCDDDFGIVDVDPQGNARSVRTRPERERWFRDLFTTLDAMGARADSVVLDYHGVQGADLGYSVLDFRRTLTVDDETASFDCVATIVWKKTPRGWREARWHASVISADIPLSLRTAIAA